MIHESSTPPTARVDAHLVPVMHYLTGLVEQWTGLPHATVEAAPNIEDLPWAMLDTRTAVVYLRLPIITKLSRLAKNEYYGCPTWVARNAAELGAMFHECCHAGTTNPRALEQAHKDLKLLINLGGGGLTEGDVANIVQIAEEPFVERNALEHMVRQVQHQAVDAARLLIAAVGTYVVAQIKQTISQETTGHKQRLRVASLLGGRASSYRAAFFYLDNKDGRGPRSIKHRLDEWTDISRGLLGEADWNIVDRFFFEYTHAGLRAAGSVQRGGYITAYLQLWARASAQKNYKPGHLDPQVVEVLDSLSGSEQDIHPQDVEIDEALAIEIETGVDASDDKAKELYLEIQRTMDNRRLRWGVTR